MLAGRRGAGVLGDEAADAGHRGLDVLLAGRAQLLVGLLERVVGRLGGALVADGEERVRDLTGARVQQGADRLVLRLGVGPERLEPVHEVVEHVVDGLGHEARLDRLDDGEGGLDGQPGEAPLRVDLFLDQLAAIGDHLRAVARHQQDIVQTWHGGESTPRPGDVVRMAEMPKGIMPGPRSAMAALTGLNFLNYLDRFIPAAVMPAIIAALHLKDSQAGSLSMLFILPFIVISPVAGWLADRKPRFQLAAIGVLVWSAATFGSGLALTFVMLAAARALTGVGESGYVVVTPSLVSDYYPPARRGRALAVFYAAIPIGSALGYVLGGAINAHWGWRWAFFLAGAPGAALALALLFLRDPPRGALDVGGASEGGAAPSAPPPASPPSLGALLRIPSFLFNTAAQIIYTFVVGGLATWMPTYFVRVRHLPLASADLMFGGVLAAAGLVGTLIGGRLGDRMAARHPSGHFLLSGWSLLLSVPFAVAGIVAPSPAIFWPAMFVALTLLFLNTGPLNAAMANVLPAQLRGWGFAMYTMAIHLLGD